MSQARTVRRAVRRRNGGGWWFLLKGLAMAVLVTLAGVAIFALLMQWIRPSDTVIRVFNQLLKLTAITVGVVCAVPRGVSPLRCALLGLCYMGLGVALYALLSGQQAPLTAYLADLGMGVACGGLVGMLRR